MPIRVICPSCARIGKAPEQVIGRTARCPACKHAYVVTTDHVRPDEDNGLDPAAGPKPTPAEETYGLDPAAIAPPKRPAPRPIVAPAPAVEDEDESEGRPGWLVPALAGGGVGAVVLVALVGWGLGLFGGREPVADASTPDVAAQAPAQPTSLRDALASQPARSAATTGEISVVDMLVLDQASEAPAATVTAEAEPDVAAKARKGAAAEVASGEPEVGKALSTAEIVEESEPSVALIKGKSSSGTGFLVGPGLVATNAHVIDDEFAPDLEVRFVSADEGQNGPLRAVLLYEDPERDLAFLAVETSLKPLRVAKSYSFRKGEDITVIGNPGIGDGQVLENAISRGVMSTKAKVNEKDFYQLSIAINPGNSGGPVFDSTGRVIGVATLKSMKQEATGFCIPIEDLQAAIAKVGAQAPADAERCRSKHRTTVAAKTLGGAGALLCIVIDLRKIDALTKGQNPAVKEALGKLEPVIDSFEKDIAATLTAESQLARKDQTLDQTARGMIGEIADNFSKLRTAVNTKKYPADDQFRKLKQNHRRLINGLTTALKIEFPKEMMVAFEDHTPSQPNVVVVAPSNLGSRLGPRPPSNNNPPRSSGVPNRAQTLRDRMQQRRNNR